MCEASGFVRRGFPDPVFFMISVSSQLAMFYDPSEYFLRAVSCLTGKSFWHLFDMLTAVGGFIRNHLKRVEIESMFTWRRGSMLVLTF
jgi:hypothetical protein